MICSLCLIEIKDTEEMVTVDTFVRHKVCSDEYNTMLADLEKISEAGIDDDI